MWIRSQDKETLTKVDHLKVVPLGGYYGIFTNNHLAPNERCNLGMYKTKEEALTILDMIEKHLEKMYVRTANYMGEPFQMPQYDEVKENE